MFGGKEGNAFTHHNALRRRVWDSSAARRWANMPVGQGIRLTTALKPPYAGAARPHPVRKSKTSDDVGSRRQNAYGPGGPEELVV